MGSRNGNGGRVRPGMIAIACCVWLAAAPRFAHAGDEVRFNRDVRPLLADTCFRCHGPGQKKAGLRLDRREEALKATESGAKPIVPGKPDESEVVRRIFESDANEVMPPPSSKKTLTAEQKSLIKRWVEQGAKYEKHWAFQTPAKPPVPRIESPGFKIQNPIDAFIAVRLKQQGLMMSAEADRETLIRRVAFALTGLPPTAEEIDTFISDSSARAYENLVERYLFSPRFGEEMARHWLDVARYADTHGLHLDNERSMWPYRDWVVRAFNDNLPFDAFTIAQIGGDLLPSPTPDQLVATGFNRCNVSTGEGGSIEAEWIFRNAIDRTSTVAEAWMGLTAGCAVCHDHKFDPLSTEEFYSLYSFFYSADGPPLDSNVLVHEPSIKLPTAAQTARLAELDRMLAETRQAVERTFAGLKYNDPGTPKAAPAESFQAWLATPTQAPGSPPPPEIKPLLDRVKNKKAASADDEAKLRSYYLQHVCASTSKAFKPLFDRITALTKERADLDNAIPSTFVFKEMATPRQAFVMARGQYDKPGKKVDPGTPAVLPPLARANPSGRATRLDLARWLVAPEHPLTSRVAVNRVWQQLFGTGLVKTSFDFGTQGDVPSHPELLDWLAVSFREGNWDVKSLVRLMVTSATFRQSSRVTPELLRRDPENRLLARGPRFRLDAEQIRDNAIFVSGLADLSMGGKGVKPYQPPNIWEPVAFTGSNTMNYVPDTGRSLYRRSLYTFLKRTAPPPFMANFDAPARETFCTRRERSNSPLQALQLMNDVQHVEAARGLATRALCEGGSTIEERITWSFRTVLSRRPEPAEAAVLADEYKAHLARFTADPDAANRLIAVGQSKPRPELAPRELAAFTLVANTLLNLDETLTRN
jgi:hypothetical protein